MFSDESRQVCVQWMTGSKYWDDKENVMLIVAWIACFLGGSIVVKGGTSITGKTRFDTM